MFPSIHDIKLAYRLTEDYSRRFFPYIPYKRLLTTVSEIDEVHGEISERQKRWSDWFDVKGFAQPTEITQPVTQFSMEDIRELELAISVPDLVNAGLAAQDPNTYLVSTISGPGDHIKYGSELREYEIVTFVPAARFANTDLVLYYQAHCVLYRPESTDYI